MKNKRFFFILGNNPGLSLVEIFTAANSIKINLKVLDYFDRVLIVEMEDGFNFSRLGGAIKFGLLVADDVQYSWSKVESILQQRIIKDQRFNFGISYYSHDQRLIPKLQQTCEKNALHWKKELARSGQSSRLVISREVELSAVIITKEKILSSGCEISLINSPSKFYYGVTLAVQDWQDFSQRDYGKPRVDAASGMLPPKLARILINLAEQPLDQKLYDPFCGSGVLLLEAMSLGYQKLIGSDISPKAIADTQKNCQWYQEQHPDLIFDYKVELGDATQLSIKLKKEKISAIITEPYLGPAWKREPSWSQLQNVLLELADLYVQFLDSAYSLLPVGGRLVMVWPVFFFKDNTQYLFQEKMIDHRQWERIDLAKLIKEHDIKEDFEFIYSRSDQFVGREILCWQKK